jgi:RimJ/RimL family protein N-acetyltransferase
VIAKNDLLDRLPLSRGKLTMREWTRQDVDLLASWPLYPFPYRGFEFRFAGMDTAERGEVFRTRQSREDAMVLVVDHREQPAICYLALREINWETGTVGNVGMRVHPAWCGRGVGTSILRCVTRWSFETGIVRWRLDVAASNARAVRCYEKVGFVRTGELWRAASNLSAQNLGKARYDFIRPHLREQEGRIGLRFWVMELADQARFLKEEVW